MSDKDEADIIEHLNAGRGLHLIKTPQPKRPEPSPEMKAMLDDMRRRERGNPRRAGRDSGGKDAA